MYLVCICTQAIHIQGICTCTLYMYILKVHSQLNNVLCMIILLLYCHEYPCNFLIEKFTTVVSLQCNILPVWQEFVSGCMPTVCTCTAHFLTLLLNSIGDYVND